MIEAILQTRERSMANGMVVEFAAFLMAAVVVTFVVVMFRRRTSQPEFPVNAAPVRPLSERSQLIEAKSVPAASRREVPPPLVVKTVRSDAAPDNPVRASASSEAPKLPAVVEMPGVLATQG